jgi:hypothetical protein
LAAFDAVLLPLNTWVNHHSESVESYSMLDVLALMPRWLGGRNDQDLILIVNSSNKPFAQHAPD